MHDDVVYEGGVLVDLPRNNKKTSVVILGIHESLAESTAAANEYFKRICKWDNVDPSEVKLFGHDLAAIQEEVSQIALFASQDVEGPLLLSTNCFDLLELEQQESQDLFDD